MIASMWRGLRGGSDEKAGLLSSYTHFEERVLPHHILLKRASALDASLTEFDGDFKRSCAAD